MLRHAPSLVGVKLNVEVLEASLIYLHCMSLLNVAFVHRIYSFDVKTADDSSSADFKLK